MDRRKTLKTQTLPGLTPPTSSTSLEGNQQFYVIFSNESGYVDFLGFTQDPESWIEKFKSQADTDKITITYFPNLKMAKYSTSRTKIDLIFTPIEETEPNSIWASSTKYNKVFEDKYLTYGKTN